jgi:hypothetical protein
MKKMSTKSKVKSTSGGFNVKGGSAKMSGQNYVGPQTAGQTTSGGQKSNPPVKGGGSGKMAGQSGAAPAVAGAVSVGGRSTDNSFKVSGGKGRMAGNSGATAAKAM